MPIQQQLGRVKNKPSSDRARSVNDRDVLKRMCRLRWHSTHLRVAWLLATRWPDPVSKHDVYEALYGKPRSGAGSPSLANVAVALRLMQARIAAADIPIRLIGGYARGGVSVEIVREEVRAA